MVPEGSVDVVIASAVPPITIEVAADFVCTGLPLSVTVTVKFDVPLAVGVPEITPVAGARVKPVGKAPAVIDHVYPGVPPLASTVCEYAVPLVPPDRVEEVIASVVAPTTIDVAADFVCTGLPLSLTLTVKLEVPLAVGVPEITPLVDARVNPAGRVPALIDHV